MAGEQIGKLHRIRDDLLDEALQLLVIHTWTLVAPLWKIYEGQVDELIRIRGYLTIWGLAVPV